MNFIKRIWNDPVGSKVIAAGILTLLGLLWAAENEIEQLWFAVERWTGRRLFLTQGAHMFWCLAAFGLGLLLGTYFNRRRTLDATAVKQERQTVTLISQLEKADWSVLKVFGLSPGPLSVGGVAASLRKFDRPRILLAVDRMTKIGFVIGAGINQFNEAQFELTAAGREQCHKKGWI